MPITLERIGAMPINAAQEDKTSIIPPDIDIGYCRLEFQDAGPSGYDSLHASRRSAIR